MFTITADELPRFMNCNGSRLMPASASAVISDTSARDEGIAAHYMAATAFTGPTTLAELVDRKAPNGFYMSSEMADHVTEYLSALDCGKVEADTSHIGPSWEVNGRCDHRNFNISSRSLVIDDFKYGWRIIEPENNWTLISHAIGSLSLVTENHPAPTKIVLRIHQPRPYHPSGNIREWVLNYDDLMLYWAALSQTLNEPNDELHTGAWCAKCPALATCPAARKASMNAIDAADMAYSDDMSNDVLSFELDTLRTAQAALEYRLNALQEAALYRLKQGAVIPNYGTDHQYGHSKWKPGYDAATLQILTGKDLSKPGTVTPAEAKRRGVPENVVKTLSERPFTGSKLIRAGADSRAKRLLNK